MSARPEALAAEFTRWPILAVSPLGQGLINDTFRVDAADGPFVLQRLNSRVYPHPERIMANLLALTRHVGRKPAVEVKLRIPAIRYTAAGESHALDGEGHCWRALELIQPAVTLQILQNARQAAAAGFALAHFHAVCRDLPAGELFDTLPGFHCTPEYFRRYQALLSRPLRGGADRDVRHCQSVIEDFAQDLDCLEQARAAGKLPVRIMHGDPKLNNFLFDPAAGRVVSLIDLDTVKPGLVHYDIGDCIRSCCHERGYDRLNMDYCRNILQGYAAEARPFFCAADYEYLYSAILLIPFELGLRFFNDYLAGDLYFKIEHPRHNLQRALALFALCRDIQARRGELEAIIGALPV